MALLIRFWPYLAVIAVIGGLALWLDARGYQRAKDDRAKADAALLAKITERLDAIDTKLGDRIATIDTTERTIVQPTLVREIQSNARYSDPAAGVSPGMLTAINKARAASGADGSNSLAVPAPADGN